MFLLLLLLLLLLCGHVVVLGAFRCCCYWLFLFLICATLIVVACWLLSLFLSMFLALVIIVDVGSLGVGLCDVLFVYLEVLHGIALTAVMYGSGMARVRLADLPRPLPNG